MYTVNPKEGKKYYLRTLLLYQSEAKCFQDICIVDGELCSSLREASGKKGSLADDELRKHTLRESSRASFVPLSKIFAVILATCSPSDLGTL